jgi:hypothetical protein
VPFAAAVRAASARRQVRAGSSRAAICGMYHPNPDSSPSISLTGDEWGSAPPVEHERHQVIPWIMRADPIDHEQAAERQVEAEFFRKLVYMVPP